MRNLALILGLACLTSAVALADANTGRVYGTVLLAGSHEPVCDMLVTIESNREPAIQVRTLGDGSYHFLAVFPGPVTITVGRSRGTRHEDVSANLPTVVEPIMIRRVNMQAQYQKHPCPSTSHVQYY
jgi:hypothetical protein